MCSKAAWFRARNSVDRSVAASPPSISLPVARAGKRSLTVIRNQWMQGAETRQCQTSISIYRRPLRRAWPEVCRLITYVPSRKLFTLGAKSWPYGAHGYSTPLASNCIKIGAKTRPLLSKLSYRSQPVGPQRNYDGSREGVRGADYMGDRLRHGIQLSLVPRA